MSLSLYKEKRRFDETPEPAGKEKSSKDRLRFVIQKHDASHLHYDFRLELDGVLKSWAVPKGPSLNPEDKRLAMMVEDHPYDYRDFEGVIPEGNYGGGTVIVWDEGYYEPMEGEHLSRKDQEKELRKALYSGNLKIVLHGKKIKGAFALFLMKARGERSWILNKKKDEFATDKDILENDRSVKSGKTMIEVAEENGTTVNHPELHKTPEKKDARSVKSSRKAKTKTGDEQEAERSSKIKNRSGGTANPSKSKSVINSLVKSDKTALRKSSMPSDVVPMLATLTDEPFDNEDWLYEIKWDGYRAVAHLDGKYAELYSRNITSFTERYYPVTDALRELGIKAVFDGEIVAVDEKGLAVFQSLQNWQNTPVRLQYYVFDLLWLEGYDITKLPLSERKKILKEILPRDHEVIKYSDHVQGKGLDFFKAAVSQGLEGIMAKKANSPYKIGLRSEDWLKIKVNKRQEVVIAGYTEPRNSRKFFGSLLLGLYEGKNLIYIGHTGSGFNKKSLEAIYHKLQPLVTEKCPFANCPKGNMPVTWVRPNLVCEIKFSEWTKDRIARHPIFMGLRIDKKAKDVSFEKLVTIAEMNTPAAEKKAAVKKAGKKKTTSALKTSAKKTIPKSSAKTTVPAKHPAVASKPSRTRVLRFGAPRKTAASSKKTATKKSVSKTTGSKSQAIKKTPATKSYSKTAPVKKGSGSLKSGPLPASLLLSGHEIGITNPDKIYWPKENFTKGDMIRYYHDIAPYMMPYMKDRPQSLNRHPNGIAGPNFYQKDVKGKVPDWMQTHIDYSESTGQDVEYLVCKDEATLLYMANLGCIEMHPWHSRTGSWQNPDWCLIDLDPDKGNSFEQVMETAGLVKKILDSIGAAAYCKTSGSTGIHIYIPLGAKYSYEQSKQLAELVVHLVNAELPDTTSVERSPSKRKGMIYLDYLQNRETQTAAAPYSLRPKPGVPVSTPLDWTELKKGLTPTTWNARNIFERLKSVGDLFKPVLGKGIMLENVLAKLASLMK